MLTAAVLTPSWSAARENDSSSAAATNTRRPLNGSRRTLRLGSGRDLVRTRLAVGMSGW
jgi:hypothetical protein